MGICLNNPQIHLSSLPINRPGVHGVTYIIPHVVRCQSCLPFRKNAETMSYVLLCTVLHCCTAVPGGVVLGHPPSEHGIGNGTSVPLQSLTTPAPPENSPKGRKQGGGTAAFVAYVRLDFQSDLEREGLLLCNSKRLTEQAPDMVTRRLSLQFFRYCFCCCSGACLCCCCCSPH